MTSFRSRVGIAVHDRKVTLILLSRMEIIVNFMVFLQIYAIGGFNGHDRLKIVESYDYNKNEWTPVRL